MTDMAVAWVVMSSEWLKRTGSAKVQYQRLESLVNVEVVSLRNVAPPSFTLNIIDESCCFRVASANWLHHNSLVSPKAMNGYATHQLP